MIAAPPKRTSLLASQKGEEARARELATESLAEIYRSLVNPNLRDEEAQWLGKRILQKVIFAQIWQDNSDYIAAAMSDRARRDRRSRVKKLVKSVLGIKESNRALIERWIKSLND